MRSSTAVVAACSLVFAQACMVGAGQETELDEANSGLIESVVFLRSAADSLDDHGDPMARQRYREAINSALESGVAPNLHSLLRSLEDELLGWDDLSAIPSRDLMVILGQEVATSADLGLLAQESLAVVDEARAIYEAGEPGFAYLRAPATLDPASVPLTRAAPAVLIFDDIILIFFVAVLVLAILPFVEAAVQRSLLPKINNGDCTTADKIYDLLWGFTRINPVITWAKSNSMDCAE